MEMINYYTEFNDVNPFKHFNTSNECIAYIHNNNIKNVSYCCSKKGFRLREERYCLLSSSDEEDRRDDQKTPIYDETHNEDEICCVCLMSNTRKTECSHILCISCDNQLHKRECPYCRQKL